MDFLPTGEERAAFLKNYRRLLQSVGDTALPGDVSKVKQYIRMVAGKNAYGRDVYGLNILNRTFNTALIVAEEIGLKRTSVLAVLLSHPVRDNHCQIKDIEKDFGEDTAGIIRGLVKTHQLYDKKVAIDNENFRTLLLSFAEDVRVVLIMIAERLYLMRMAKHFADEDHRLQIAAEASYLYAPLSHRLGLYKIKSELEDLSLKFQDREMYDFIARKINETKRSRDKYIAEFIAPIEKKLQESGLNFDIKGRTKSIHSIRNKLLKQQIEFENIYDLFAIRIILDTPVEKEKAECWQVYSVVTDMYQPNPKRMKDWLSIPKSNGYESLHTTVMGPEGRWVEVQIRSKRMDEIAEKGLAAHWKYKGGKSSGLDNWLNNVREVLENKDSTPVDLIHDFKMDLYDEEIFVFTPKGDLFKLPQNSTVLDFAFAVHTKIGSKCVSARINGKNVSIKHKLQSGDQVDIQTSPNQTPKQDWLSFVVTGKARVKIKQSLKEQAAKQVEFARELLHRRFKNRKIEADEPVLMRLIKKKGYKNVTDFYADIATGHLEANTIIDQYLEQEKKEQEAAERTDRSVENYHAPNPVTEENLTREDVLVIDKNLTGIDYTLAKCCNPIYGDEIFGFVSSQGIKIHRLNCPNAPAMFKKYGYRIVKSRWAGKSGASYPVTLKVVGHDDIGIVTNITSVIAKENGMTLRSIAVDSSDGLFQGTLTVMLSDTSVMNSLIKKIKAVKGVKQVNRY
ncbi:MAG: RelA/SpoT family protein [Dysgonamonadaceae bacterium]|jgi:GTP pyrophosphokinase|nr:RelA/SpoT family protein [Dysgonamonadaceae bacterium]